jgi:hypothetical protein
LGVAQYRAGRWHEAIATLTDADRFAQGRRQAPRGFFLAMAHWRAGQEAEALRRFRLTAAWMAERLPDRPDLFDARSEAAALFRPADQDAIGRFPSDPFAR